MKDFIYDGISQTLIVPLNDGIAELKNRILQGNDEYYKFELEQNRQGNKVTLQIYYDSLLHEIQRIWDSAISMERQLKNDGKEVKFNSVFSGLIDCRKIVEEKMGLIEIINIENSFPVIHEIGISTTKKISDSGEDSFRLVNVTNANLGNLESVCNALKKGKFISSTTTLPQFKKVLSGNIVVKKIEWIGNVNELNFFIKRLHNCKNPETKKAKVQKVKNLWSVVLKCFTGRNKAGKQFNAIMLQTNSGTPAEEIRNQIIKAVNHIK